MSDEVVRVPRRKVAALTDRTFLTMKEITAFLEYAGELAQQGYCSAPPDSGYKQQRRTSSSD